MAFLSPLSLPSLPFLSSSTSSSPSSSRTTPRASLNSQDAVKSACKTLAAAAAAVILTLPSAPLTPPAYAARGGGASFLSASGDVIKDPESLLRWALPVSNKSVRELQAELEGAITDLRGLKWAKVDAHVKSATRVLNAQKEKILADVPAEIRDDAREKLERVSADIPKLGEAVVEKSTDKVTNVARGMLREVGFVEESMVKGFPYDVPNEYKDLPQLKGRAQVEMVVKKGEGDFDIEGRLYKEGKMRIILDGYSAPISAGAFADLVQRGFYDGSEVIRSDGFIVQAGKGKNGEDGFTEEGKVRTIPLEVFARGDKMPTYGVTLEEDGRGSVGTVLPFSAYGTVAMARKEFENDSASSQFFWFLFEPDLTPAGRNLMDGSWGVVGYTVGGEGYLRGVQRGDIIVSAKLVEGAENLVVPVKTSSSES